MCESDWSHSTQHIHERVCSFFFLVIVWSHFRWNWSLWIKAECSTLWDRAAHGSLAETSEHNSGFFSRSCNSLGYRVAYHSFLDRRALYIGLHHILFPFDAKHAESQDQWSGDHLIKTSFCGGKDRTHARHSNQTCSELQKRRVYARVWCQTPHVSCVISPMYP